jgi:hypothetical protein
MIFFLVVDIELDGLNEERDDEKMVWNMFNKFTDCKCGLWRVAAVWGG